MPNDQESQAEIDVIQVPATRGGPQTDIGKEACRRNAWKHGFAAETLEVPNSERAAYELRRVHYLADMLPESQLERTLVERVCRNSWKLERIAEEEDKLISFQRSLERAVTEALNQGDHDRADEIAEVQADLEQKAKLLARYEKTAEHGFHKALSAFLRLRKDPKLLKAFAFPEPPKPSYAPRREAPANVQPRSLPAAPNEPKLDDILSLLSAVKSANLGTPPLEKGRRQR